MLQPPIGAEPNGEGEAILAQRVREGAPQVASLVPEVECKARNEWLVPGPEGTAGQPANLTPRHPERRIVCADNDPGQQHGVVPRRIAGVRRRHPRSPHRRHEPRVDPRIRLGLGDETCSKGSGVCTVGGGEGELETLAQVPGDHRQAR